MIAQIASGLLGILTGCVINLLITLIIMKKNNKETLSDD